MGISDSQLNAAEEKAQDGIIREFVREDTGLLTLIDTCQVAGLGGNPYRNGNYEYYISEPKRVNDMKGVGAFILAFAHN